MAACGASYIARWTVLQLRDLEDSITEAMGRHGFRFIEAITPCPTVYGRMNKRPVGLDDMLYYQNKSIVRNGADPKDAGITIDSPILVGKFVDIQYPTYQESQDDILTQARDKGKL